MNAWGYYGDGAILGSESIVGEWEIANIYEVSSFLFKEDGTGNFTSDGEIQTSGDGNISYGVNENGTQLIVAYPDSSHVSSYNCIKFENFCCYISDEEALCKVIEGL